MNLSAHFTLAELTASDTAIRLGIDNTAPPEALPNLVRLAQVLEQVRALFGMPLIINSGYRSPAVNRAVGGSAISAHCDGRAADFVVPEYGTPKAVAQRIARSPIAFDQLIFEGTWCHLSIPRRDEVARLHILTAHFDGGPATYTVGLA